MRVIGLGERDNLFRRLVHDSNEHTDNKIYKPRKKLDGGRARYWHIKYVQKGHERCS